CVPVCSADLLSWFAVYVHVHGDVTCQYIQRKQRLKDNYLLVKSSQNSSGETVTSMLNMSPALPKKERRYRKKRSRDYQEEIPSRDTSK
ncbi:hypothetical protein KUCAC02_016763, partial [Chaenocephalus aceratus]